ncbi:L,D-peptidoglycan transpeptidase YkuD (ErfK/YbiS/YcfS/YnhG family) [Tepidamorphus gemmatus]|jgi:L,D-peptidoglycan transpeptidase YkuD (ErfK/YbiS/YcfS/YnhG family)|uniref:L,D-peptidoglycan transpeptidase YkuD (ErfK/YbiS/YcfS/YnhG family) n=1 Tax=Tepidamorphus gemmatus TaxID=747076 RepID=A0A4R3MFB6_9HYPH|nr:L,D-transpeptidase family protein [Tepidamorphus gemmatus]TCT11852.1 L,D-peptidoglycan transpeptidase YkuD (ErfK/YbiS/YcfS/YnhG family) [Tepidamorphus gemmatus]
MTAPADVVRVHATGVARGLMQAGGCVWPCALGRSGLTRLKREGDGATPRGSFALGPVYYRPDRGPPPRTGLDVVAIDPQLGWCDDPARCAYNRPVRLPFAGSHERMWREDGLYDWVVVIGHNTQPPLRPFGSAIFLHLARPGLLPTEGCIALRRADMAKLLPRLGPGTRLVVG